MATYKNETGGPVEITRYELRVQDGQTFEVPDEDTSFENRPGFTSSRVKNPDVTPDPAVVTDATAAVPAAPVPSSPAA